MVCNSSFIFYFLFFSKWINVSLTFFHKNNQVFLIFKYKQITILVSRKTKKRFFLWGYFDIFTRIFCVIKRTMRGVLIFFMLYFVFVNKKTAKACSTRPNEWATLVPLRRRARYTSQWLNLFNRLITICAAKSK